MECSVIKDLIPLYIDDCCSEENRKIVAEHMESCAQCRKLFGEMKAQTGIGSEAKAPAAMSKLNFWKASVMQSLLLFFSFALITIGVALEAGTSLGSMNGFWALNLVVPATGFMLSLANWYFVRSYKSKKSFSVCSFIATLGFTVCAYIWVVFHYESSFIKSAEGIQGFLSFTGIGLVLTAVFCVISRIFSDKYAQMLGKE